jgi:hypothetical protein
MSKGSQSSTATIPEWQKSMYQEVFGAGRQIAQQPFIPYTGPQVAGFNPDQLRQFQATRGLFESAMGYDPRAGLQQLAQAPAPTIAPVTGTTAQIGQVAMPTAATIQQIPTFGGAQVQQIAGPLAAQIGDVQAPQFRGLLDVDIGAYQSPYQQQVIDLALQDIQRQSDIAQQQAQSQAIRAGAFGGSRSALLESEATRPYAEQAARTAAQLRQSGFQQAQQAAQADLARQQQLGLFGAEQAQQRALQQAQLAQQAGLAGYEGALQRAQQQATLAQQAGLAGQDVAAQRALQQAQLQQQAGLLGAEQAQQRALEQARLAQQTGMAELDIAGRAALMQPELDLRTRQFQAGLLGGQLEDQYRGLGLLGGIGTQQQQLQQQALNQAYNEFLRAQGYGQQQLGALTQGLSGIPALVGEVSKKKTGPGDILASIAGIFS